MSNSDLDASIANNSPLPGEERFKPLYRGVWAEHLGEDDELPVGGTIFSSALTLNMKLDFENLGINHDKINTTFYHDAFEQSRQSVEDWMEQAGITGIDPRTVFTCINIQYAVNSILGVDDKQLDEPDQRLSHYHGEAPPISAFVGKSRCTERAALAQHLLQEVGVESAYVGGFTMLDAHDENEDPEAHSYIVLKPSSEDENADTYIFDVARPHSAHGIARIMRATHPFTYGLLSGKDDFYVRCTDVIPTGNDLYFGVGEPIYGPHEIAE